jgi:hypothetical protein
MRCNASHVVIMQVYRDDELSDSAVVCMRGGHLNA